MIARAWHGRVPEGKADAYFEYLRATGLKEYEGTAGNRGVYVLRSRSGGFADFLLVSLWDSWDAIRRFAGADIEKAVYYPEDRGFLVEMEPTVTHYEVLAAPGSTARKS
ncbi:MAG TPA: antibiotic biosynthesis monooxygenase [Thermoplasmata archaeon]|nr:antibiotic biosynthesis monooxygenase [Thermoplasmata archaeon]